MKNKWRTAETVKYRRLLIFDSSDSRETASMSVLATDTVIIHQLPPKIIWMAVEVQINEVQNVVDFCLVPLVTQKASRAVNNIEIDSPMYLPIVSFLRRHFLVASSSFGLCTKTVQGQLSLSRLVGIVSRETGAASVGN